MTTQGRMTFCPSKLTGFFLVGVYDKSELVWIDIVRSLQDVIRLPQLNRVVGFDPSKEYEVVLFGQYEKSTEARNALYAIAGTNVPKYNIGVRRQEKVIVCNETGEEFRNASELIKAKGLNPNSVYPHLRGDAGHKTVHGLTYCYKDSVGAAERVTEIGYACANDTSYTPDAAEVNRLEKILGKTAYDTYFNQGVMKAWKI